MKDHLCIACNAPINTQASWRSFCYLCREKLAWVRAQVNATMRAANIPHPSGFKCSDCDAPATAYDHRCYSLPLEVDPICHACNARRGHAVDVVECINAVKGYGFIAPTTPEHTSKPKPPKASQTRREGIDGDLHDIQVQRITQAIQESAGNVSKAARMLGINRTTLYSRMDALGIAR